MTTASTSTTGTAESPTGATTTATTATTTSASNAAALSRPAPQPAPPEAGGWIARLWPFMAAHRRNVVIAFGVSMAGQGISALTPLLAKIIVDDVITTRSRQLAPWIALLVAAGIFGFAAAYVRRFVGGRVALDVQFDLRNAVYERLQRLDFASHDQLRTGQLVSRSSSDVALLQGLLAFLPIMLGNLVLVVVALIVMVVLSPPLTLVALLVVPAMAVAALRLRTTIFPPRGTPSSAPGRWPAWSTRPSRAYGS